MKSRTIVIALVFLLALMLSCWWSRRARPEGPVIASAGHDSGPLAASSTDPGVASQNPAPGTKPAILDTSRTPRLIRGQVFDAGGSGEGRFEVHARLFPTKGTSEYAFEDVRQKPDASGFFCLKAPGPGRVLIGLSDWPDPYFGLEVDVPPDRDVDGVQLRLPEIWPLLVTFVDGAGRPISNASIRVMTDRVCLNAVSGEDGTCTFQILQGDSVSVQAELPEAYRSKFVWPEITAVSRGATSVRLIAAVAGIASGITLGADGRPQSMALSVIANGTFCYLGHSGNDGKFEACVPMEGASIISASSENASGQIEGVHAGDTGLEIRAIADPPRDRNLTVRVRGPSGLVKDASFELEIKGQVFDSDQEHVDSEGVHSWKDLPHGPASVRAWIPFDPAHPLWIDPAGVLTTADAEAVEFVAEEGAVFSGTIKVPENVDLIGFSVRASADGHEIASQGGTGMAFSLVVPRTQTLVMKITVDAWSLTKAYSGSADRVDPGSPIEIVVQPQ